MVTNVMMPAFMGAAGYDVSIERTPYEESDKYKEFRARESRILSDLQVLDSRIGVEGEGQSLFDQRNNLNRELSALREQEASFISDWEDEISYDAREMDSPEVEYIRSKYGADSAEYNKAKEKEIKAAVDLDKKTKEITGMFMEKAKKFMQGDFAVTEDQKAFVRDIMAPQRDAVTNLFDSLTEEADKTEKSLLDVTEQTFQEYEKKVGETSLNVNQAFDAVSDQIRETGVDMETALDSVVKTNQELLKMGIEDYTGQITKQVATSAAMIGRNPQDPEYAQEIQTSVAREIQRGVLTG